MRSVNYFGTLFNFLCRRRSAKNNSEAGVNIRGQIQVVVCTSIDYVFVFYSLTSDPRTGMSLARVRDANYSILSPQDRCVPEQPDCLGNCSSNSQSTLKP